MMRAMAGGLKSDRRASVVVEFAVVGTALFVVSLGAMDLGLILWTQGALQSVAADAARCGAISAAGCTSSSAITTYAQTEAANWILTPIANGLTVNVNGAASTTACPAISVGTYETVEITTSYFSGWLPPPFNNYTIDVCASYAT